MRIGFIGAGKVGVSLGKYFTEKGIFVVGYYSKTIDSATDAARFTNTQVFKDMQGMVGASDTLFLTVPDGTIKEIWDCMSRLPIKNKIICHCSGSLSSKVFTHIHGCNAYGYSIHPIFPFHHKYESHQQLSHAAFTLEGSEPRLEFMRKFLAGLGNPVTVISDGNKGLYHSATVFASNFVTALAQTALDLFQTCGFAEDDALQALLPLLLSNVNNLKKGPVQALTGPVERLDMETVRLHLECLRGQDAALYCLLSEKLAAIGGQKHSERDYSHLTNLLEDRYEKLCLDVSRGKESREENRHADGV